MRIFCSLPFFFFFVFRSFALRRKEDRDAQLPWVSEIRSGQVRSHSFYVSGLQCEVKEGNKMMLEYYSHISRYMLCTDGVLFHPFLPLWNDSLHRRIASHRTHAQQSQTRSCRRCNWVRGQLALWHLAGFYHVELTRRADAVQFVNSRQIRGSTIGAAKFVVQK